METLESKPAKPINLEIQEAVARCLKRFPTENPIVGIALDGERYERAKRYMEDRMRNGFRSIVLRYAWEVGADEPAELVYAPYIEGVNVIVRLP